MECPIGGPRCFEGCAQGNLALNYSPMSHTTEGPRFLIIRHSPRATAGVPGRRVGRHRRAPQWRVEGHLRVGCVAMCAHVAPPMVSEGLKGPFACSASMKGLSL